MQPLCYLAARTTNGNKAAQGVLMLKGIIIYFMIISVKQQVLPSAGRFKNIARPPAKAGAAGHGGLRCVVREFKPFDNNIPGRTNNIKTVGSAYNSAASGLRLYGNGLCSGALFINVDICTGGVCAIGKNNDIAGHCIINSRLQGR